MSVCFCHLHAPATEVKAIWKTTKSPRSLCHPNRDWLHALIDARDETKYEAARCVRVCPLNPYASVVGHGSTPDHFPRPDDCGYRK